MEYKGLRFAKMHGLGNDFVVIDAINQRFEPTPENVRRLADRHRGIGCDQLLLVEPAEGEEADFRYRIFNADGGEVGQCGNGARCFARFVVDHGLAAGPEIRVETLGGPMRLRLEPDGQVCVDMGVPRFDPADVPFDAPERARRYPLEVGGEHHEIAAVSMGNPHAILRVDDLDAAPVARLGPLIEAHPRFPQRVNVGFMQIITPRHIRLRVFERGVGETQACGSGACAAVAVGRDNGWLEECVAVDLTGGGLMIRWEGEGKSLRMTGPASTVYEGRVA
ncbi:diaminopimelate epimerase [Acidihalobacter yilgarnensis]|uniref:Diaminopimelate epimerase n=1 Tax=Acidihalobacter yilgarnensis TaxID=2819280 RepID=A0A1D8IJM5_9GAMM|nr:diaminopimelate epimerase [Acidihalobacter yilgarnensis]AOU96645.1 diaminopimelate epimerase [Acidihalobacter yilgarnensis]